MKTGPVKLLCILFYPKFDCQWFLYNGVGSLCTLQVKMEEVCVKEEPTGWYTDNESDKFPHASTSLEFGVGSGGEGVAGSGGGVAEYPSGGGGGGDAEGGGGGRGTSAVVWNMVQSQLMHHTQPTTSTMPAVSVTILSLVVIYIVHLHQEVMSQNPVPYEKKLELWLAFMIVVLFIVCVKFHEKIDTLYLCNGAVH